MRKLLPLLACLCLWALPADNTGASRSYTFFFLPGLMPGRTFRAFSMSRAVQSLTFTVPTFSGAGALMVPAAM